MAGNLDRFTVDGGLEIFQEYLKTKIGIRRPQEKGMASASTRSNVREVSP